MAQKTKHLVCKQCGYANEGERVYCHNCGTKLDRSLLPATTETEEPLAKKQKRIRKIVTPSRGFFAGSWKTLLYTILCAVLVASLILMAMPPEGVPAKAGSDDLPRSISMELEDATQAAAPAKLTFTQAEINPYLQYSIKAATTGFLGDEAKFVRVFTNIDEDLIRISVEESVFGHPVYFGIYYRLAVKNHKLETTVNGGNFGRLQIHPQLMKYLDTFFQKLWDASELKRDKRLLDQCQSIEVHKDHVDVLMQPPAAP